MNERSNERTKVDAWRDTAARARPIESFGKKWLLIAVSLDLDLGRAPSRLFRFQNGSNGKCGANLSKYPL